MNLFFKFTTMVLIKYIVLYQISDNSDSWNDWKSLKTIEDIFFIAWMFLFLPITEILILYFPFEFILNYKKLAFLFGFIVLIGIECILSLFFLSNEISSFITWKLFLSLVLYVLFFTKEIRINLI
jgi:hypothetical protein